jgi:hypothetical protein
VAGECARPVGNHDPEDRRALRVITIIPHSGGLELVARDDSGDPDEPILGSVLVNYYPGYRLYLHADSAHGFDASAIMPAAGQSARLTLVGARSCDTLGADTAGQHYDYRSNMSVPAVLSAIEIIAPGVPDQPTGLLYATPPDGEGVASYAFTVGFQGRTPFALTFFRADALSILRALYKPKTCVTIVGASRFRAEPGAARHNRRYGDPRDPGAEPVGIGGRRRRRKAAAAELAQDRPQRDLLHLAARCLGQLVPGRRGHLQRSDAVFRHALRFAADDRGRRSHLLSLQDRNREQRRTAEPGRGFDYGGSGAIVTAPDDR